MDRERFLAAVEKCSGKQRDIKGIGTLGERSVHATLKAYFEPQADNTEIKIGSFVADIAGENGIIEIQTRALYRLRKKLDCFLEYTHVTVVYPVIAKKYINWLDSVTGEVVSRRLSPKRDNIYTAMGELMYLKYALDNPRFTFAAVLIEVEDMRLLDGYSKDKKRGSTKFDRYPVDILGEYWFECAEDYMMLVPPQLEGEFTSADFAKAAGIDRKLSQSTLNILTYVGAVKRVGRRKGNEIIYIVNE